MPQNPFFPLGLAPRFISVHKMAAKLASMLQRIISPSASSLSRSFRFYCRRNYIQVKKPIARLKYHYAE